MDGRPYELEPADSDLCWMRIDDEFYFVDPGRKIYEKKKASAAERGGLDFSVPVIFATLLEVDAIRRRFDVSLPKDSELNLTLLAKPQRAQECPQRWWFIDWRMLFGLKIGDGPIRMQIVFDRPTQLPASVRLRGDDWTVSIYSFESVMLNSTEAAEIAVTEDFLDGFTAYIAPGEPEQEECADALQPVFERIEPILEGISTVEPH